MKPSWGPFYTKYFRIVYLSICGITAVLLILARCLRPFPETSARISWWIGRSMTRYFLFPLLGIRIECRGFHHIPKKDPLLMIANHQCPFDQFMIYSALPRPYRAVLTYGADSLTLGPISSFLPQLGFLIMQTTVPEKVQEGLREIRCCLEQGEQVLMLPEENPVPPEKGLGQFKRGCGVILRQMNVPVVLLNIEGSAKITQRPPYLTPAKVSIEAKGPFHIEIGQTGDAFKDSCDIANHIRQMFIREFEQAQTQ